MQQTEQDRAVKSRWALEALRNGVPNRAAVEMLGCNQPQAQERFTELLQQVADTESPASRAVGMLVSGDFGTGKSHLLTHLEHVALSEGFVCSRVSVSKETPLYDLRKVFASAIDNGRMPLRSGRLMEEIGLKLDVNSAGYASFFQWANSADPSVLSPQFAASLLIHERSNDLELNSEIESFWGGDRILMSHVKDGLRQIGQLSSYALRAPSAAELPAQRLSFAVELIKAAGYKGWVVLLDEIELVASYSLLQRARSYAELARWTGQAPGASYPGLITVGTVTDDFGSAMITDGKMDRDNVGPKLQLRNGHLEEPAKVGMQFITHQALPLKPPSEADVQATMEKIRRIYSDAYRWDAPPIAGSAGGAGFRSRMRYKVRSAINEWDLLRLYPDYQPETVSEEFRHTYDEDSDIEREPQDGDAEPPVA